MQTALEGASRGAPKAEAISGGIDSAALLQKLVSWLDEAKAEEVVAIDLKGKSTIGDFMVIASGRSDRHVGAIADDMHKKLKEAGCSRIRVQGTEACDWVVIDTGDLIVHIFRPEVREFYRLERMWSGDRPADAQTH